MRCLSFRFLTIFGFVFIFALVGCRKEKERPELGAPASQSDMVGGEVSWNPTLIFDSETAFTFTDASSILGSSAAGAAETRTGTWENFLRGGPDFLRFNLVFDDFPDLFVDVEMTDFRGSTTTRDIMTARLTITVDGEVRVDQRADITGVRGTVIVIDDEEEEEVAPPQTGTTRNGGVANVLDLGGTGEVPAGIPDFAFRDNFDFVLARDVSNITFTSIIENVPAEIRPVFTNTPVTEAGNGVNWSVEYEYEGLRYSFSGRFRSGNWIIDTPEGTVRSAGFMDVNFTLLGIPLGDVVSNRVYFIAF